MTNRLAFFICQQLTKLINMTSVAKIANVSVSTVMRIFEEDKKAVDLMLLYNDDLHTAHILKEWFYEICQSDDYSYQCSELIKWIESAECSGIAEFKKCANTYKNWINEIKNAFRYGYTNGPTEGFNNKIKVLKRISFGIRNFKRFRNRIIHCTN